MPESDGAVEPAGRSEASSFSLPPLQTAGAAMPLPNLPTYQSTPGVGEPQPIPDAFSTPQPVDERRPRRSAFAIVAAVVVAAAIGGFLMLTGGSSGFTSPSAANAALFAAARSAGSFHYSGSSTGSDAGTVLRATVSGDSGRTQGIQFLFSRVANYEVIVIGSLAYMKADEGAWEDSFGFPASQASDFANRWISLTPSDSLYKSVAAGVTTPSNWNNSSESPSDNLPQTPAAVSPVTTVGGRSVQAVRYSLAGASKAAGVGHYSGTESIVFAARGPHVPYSLTEHLTGTDNGSPATDEAALGFSNWGEKVSLTAPAGAIPFSALPSPPMTV